MNKLRQIHARIPTLRLIFVLLTGLGAFAAALESHTQKTYCVGNTESFGKRYRYCRQLSVEMLSHADGSFEFGYRMTDDQGKLLESEYGHLTVKAEELGAFITICYQAWDLVYNRAEPPQPSSMAKLQAFRGTAADYLCEAYGTSHLIIDWLDSTPDETNPLSLPMEGVCATLSLLSQTAEGKKQLGDGKRFRAGLRKERVSTRFKEQEEIDLIRSIVDKINAGNWGNWEISVLHGAVDFRTLSDKEKQYISKAFARHGPASKAGCRMDSDVSFIVRLKLSDPETLKDLSEAFRVGYFDASDAAAVCRRVADVRLLPIAAKFLFTDKAPKKVEMSDVLVEVSPSIHSASAISGLLAVCPEFPEAVRKAVKTWDHYDISQQDFLSIYRKWWSENRQRIEKGKYGEVTAPASRQ